MGVDGQCLFVCGIGKHHPIGVDGQCLFVCGIGKHHPMDVDGSACLFVVLVIAHNGRWWSVLAFCGVGKQHPMGVDGSHHVGGCS